MIWHLAFKIYFCSFTSYVNLIHVCIHENELCFVSTKLRIFVKTGYMVYNRSRNIELGIAKAENNEIEMQESRFNTTSSFQINS